MAKPLGASCQLCSFWEPIIVGTSTSTLLGRCRYNAPAPEALSSEELHTVTFPVVRINDWCSMFKKQI